MTRTLHSNPGDVVAQTLGKAVDRRSLVRSIAGIGAGVALATTVGRASAEHTSQLYTVYANTNLRSGPGTNHSVLAVIPKGATFTLNAREQNNFYSVSYKGTIGWLSAPLIHPVAGGHQDPVIVGSARTTATVNLRSGPSTGNSVLRVVSKGASVQISSTVRSGFRYVIHNGLAGWIADQYLAADGSQPGQGTFTTTARLNLRAAPNTGAAVKLVIPSGATVKALAGVANGWREVSYQGTSGWAATTYLN